MSYKVKSDQSAQLMYIKDTNEYKIVVDVGDVIYVFDTPANSTIYQLTDLQEVAGQSEQQVRASAGIYVTDNDTFMSGFFNNDRLVSVAIDVNQITPAIADDAQDILKTFFDAFLEIVFGPQCQPEKRFTTVPVHSGSGSNGSS